MNLVQTITQEQSPQGYSGTFARATRLRFTSKLSKVRASGSSCSKAWLSNAAAAESAKRSRSVKFRTGSASKERSQLHSPKIEKIEVVRRGKVRRAKLYYLRKLRGKAARIKER